MKDLIKRILKEELHRWTKEEVFDLAKNFSRMNHFKKAHPRAYGAARSNKWIEDLRKIMTPAYESWDEDKIRKIASNYNNLQKFFEEQPKAYYAARSLEIYDEITNHMERGFHYWTKDEVIDVASKYNNRRDFITNDNSAYQAAVNNGWYDEISKEWDYLGNLYKRMVYAFEFPDNVVYVGLTLSKEKRFLAHMISGPVYKHKNKTGLDPIMIVVSDEYIDAKDAQQLEDCTIQKYKSEGWTVLNTAKAGGLGGCTRIWDKESVMEIALRYTYMNQFKKENPNAYQAALRNGWIDEINKTMIPKYKIRNDEDIVKLLSKFNTLSDFRKNDYAGFNYVLRKIGYPKIKEYYNK